MVVMAFEIAVLAPLDNLMAPIIQALVIQAEKAGSQSAVWQDVPVAGAVTDGE